MRISTSQIHQVALTAMTDQQALLSKTQQQLATGNRLLAPADDPSASAQILLLKQSVDITTQYQRNIDAARNRLGLEEAALAGAGDVIQRARELAVKGNNGTLSDNDRSAIAVEIRQLSEQMLGLANTKDSSGEYLFAGFHAASQPFTVDGSGTVSYNGDQGVRQLQIGPTRHIEVGDAGDKVFMNVPASAGGLQSIFATLNTYADNLEANTATPTTIADLDAALKSILAARSNIGARQNAVDSQSDVNTDYLLQMQTSLSEVKDLDYAEAITRYNQQTVALQAAQNSYTKLQGLSLFNYL